MQENIPLIQKVIKKKDRNGNRHKILGNTQQNRPKNLNHIDNINTWIMKGLNYQIKRDIM